MSVHPAVLSHGAFLTIVTVKNAIPVTVKTSTVYHQPTETPTHLATKAVDDGHPPARQPFPAWASRRNRRRVTAMTKASAETKPGRRAKRRKGQPGNEGGADGRQGKDVNRPHRTPKPNSSRRREAGVVAVVVAAVAVVVVAGDAERISERSRWMASSLGRRCWREKKATEPKRNSQPGTSLIKAQSVAKTQKDLY